MTRFLVTGASGLLGVNFALEFAAQHDVVGVVNRYGLAGAPFRVLAADLTQAGEVERLLDEVQPEVIINCAAQAILDECEAQPDLAERVNAWMPGQLAAAAARRHMRLLHLSTDAVFDGQKGNYRESDVPNPLSVYARTKLAGERTVAQANACALVARVNFYGWSLRGQRSLGEFFYNNLAAGRQVNGFTDIFFCPLQVNELAHLLVEMLEQGLTGLYHVVSGHCLSKYDFGLAIARQFGFNESLVIPTSVASAGLKAPRSPRLTLNTQKAEQALGRPLPALQPGLAYFFGQQQNGYVERLKSLNAQKSEQNAGS